MSYGPWSPRRSWYKLLTKTIMLAYRVSLGIGVVPTYLDGDLLRNVAEQHKDFLLVAAEHLATPPVPAELRHGRVRSCLPAPPVPSAPTPQVGQITLAPGSAPAQVAAAPAPPALPAPEAAPAPTAPPPAPTAPPVTPPEVTGKVSSDPSDPEPGLAPSREEEPEQPPGGSEGAVESTTTGELPQLPLDFFRKVVRRYVAELEGQQGGRSRRNHLGSP